MREAVKPDGSGWRNCAERKTLDTVRLCIPVGRILLAGDTALAFVHHFDDHVLGETLVRWWSQGFRTGLLMEPEGKRVSEHKCN